MNRETKKDLWVVIGHIVGMYKTSSPYILGIWIIVSIIWEIK